MNESLDERDRRVGGFVRPRQLVEYADRYGEHFRLTRTADGILTVRAHFQDGPARWSRGLLNAWGQLLGEVVLDRDNEVVILTGTGSEWVGGLDPNSFAEPLHSWSADVLWEQYRDGVALLERLAVDVQVPTIGVLNGPGPRQELALMCDLTLCADAVTFGDGNFAAGSVPGDGMFLILSELVGVKHATALVYTGQRLTAGEAVELGLVNEALPASQVMQRAAELARLIVEKPRAARRMTHGIVARHWQAVVTQLREHYAHQLLAARP